MPGNFFLCVYYPPSSVLEYVVLPRYRRGFLIPTLSRRVALSIGVPLSCASVFRVILDLLIERPHDRFSEQPFPSVACHFMGGSLGVTKIIQVVALKIVNSSAVLR